MKIKHKWIQLKTVRPTLKLYFYTAIGIGVIVAYSYTTDINFLVKFVSSLIAGFYIGEASLSLAGIKKTTAKKEFEKELEQFYLAYEHDNEKDKVIVSNFLFFFMGRNDQKCTIRYPHDLPDMPCMKCSPKEWNALQKQRRKQRELVGNIFEDKKNFNI